jgi:DNA-binding HxlR family transcriptional regulator
MVVLDLLGRRWTLRILWELKDGPLSFRALQDRCEEMSSSVLNKRLAELRDAGIIDLQAEGGYCLTTEGRSLCAAIADLNSWAKRWAKRGSR